MVLTGVETSQCCPQLLRRIEHHDLETGKTFDFPTNNFVLPALTVTESCGVETATNRIRFLPNEAQIRFVNSPEAANPVRTSEQPECAFSPSSARLSRGRFRHGKRPKRSRTAIKYRNINQLCKQPEWLPPFPA